MICFVLFILIFHSGTEFTQFVIHSAITGKSLSFTYNMSGSESEYEGYNSFQLKCDGSFLLEQSEGSHMQVQEDNGEDDNEEGGEEKSIIPKNMRRVIAFHLVTPLPNFLHFSRYFRSVCSRSF